MLLLCYRCHNNNNKKLYVINCKALISHSPAYLQSTVSVLEKGLAAPMIILCISLNHSQSSRALLSPGCSTGIFKSGNTVIVEENAS